MKMFEYLFKKYSETVEYTILVLHSVSVKRLCCGIPVTGTSPQLPSGLRCDSHPALHALHIWYHIRYFMHRNERFIAKENDNSEIWIRMITFSLTDWLTLSLTDLLTDWLADSLTDSSTHTLTHTRFCTARLAINVNLQNINLLITWNSYLSQQFEFVKCFKWAKYWGMSPDPT